MLRSAVDALLRSKPIIYPTDTLLGLGVVATDKRALERLLDLKGRPAGWPISVAVSSYAELESYAELTDAARVWVRFHLPGPWTAVVEPSPRGRKELPSVILGEEGTLGVRIPDHPAARELARRVGPITCTSANRHGEAPCRTIVEARRTFGSRVAVYVTAPPAPTGRPSTIIDLTKDPPRIRERR